MPHVKVPMGARCQGCFAPLCQCVCYRMTGKHTNLVEQIVADYRVDGHYLQSHGAHLPVTHLPPPRVKGVKILFPQIWLGGCDIVSFSM